MKWKEYCLSSPKQIYLEERNPKFKFHNSTTEWKFVKSLLFHNRKTFHHAQILNQFLESNKLWPVSVCHVSICVAICGGKIIQLYFIH
jgi:hypothetical protein